MKKLIFVFGFFVFNSVLAFGVANWNQEGTEYRTANAIVASLCNFDGSDCISIAGGGVAGSDTWVQFNDGGVMGAETDFSYVKGTNTLSVTNLTVSGTASIGTIAAGGTVFTVADGDNAVVLTLNQEDVTNNPKAFIVSNTGTGNSVEVDGSAFVVKGDGFVGIGTASPDTILQIPNNNWFSAKDNAGTGFISMFKVNTSDEIEVGGTLNIGTIGFTEDSGAVALVDMPVSSTPVDGTEESYAFQIDAETVATIKASSDGTGGIDELQLIVAPTVGNNASFPSLAFGDGDTGFYEGVDDTLMFSSSGGDEVSITSSGVNLFTLIQEDVGATCTLGQLRYDTGGATDELCYCQATDTWMCTALTVGVTD